MKIDPKWFLFGAAATAFCMMLGLSFPATVAALIGVSIMMFAYHSIVVQLWERQRPL